MAVRSGAYARNAEKSWRSRRSWRNFPACTAGRACAPRPCRQNPCRRRPLRSCSRSCPGCITRYPGTWHLRIGKKDFFPTFAQYEQDNTPLLLQLDACCAGYPGGAEALAGHAAAVMLDGLAAPYGEGPALGQAHAGQCVFRHEGRAGHFLHAAAAQAAAGAGRAAAHAAADAVARALAEAAVEAGRL